MPARRRSDDRIGPALAREPCDKKGNLMHTTREPLRVFILGALMMASTVVSTSLAQEDKGEGTSERKYRGRLGPGNKKIKRQNGKTLLWAGDQSQWFDFTGAPMPAEELQFGIGKDRLRSIDDPLFVSPDDPRLLERAGRSHYRPKERPQTNDEIPVIGYAEGGQARAYPTALLDRHEVVNDRIGGKAVAVSW